MHAIIKLNIVILSIIILIGSASAALPIANAGTDQTVYVGDTVTFSGASSSDPDPEDTITSYYWNFADGTYGTGVYPTHVYTTAASYSVTLTVTDMEGGIAQDTVVINVRAADNTPPTITHTEVTSASAGSDVSITATITDTNLIYSAILFYRVGSSGNYTQLTMSATGDVYSAAIPAVSVTTAGVQYYIEAKDSSSNRNVARSPSGAPNTPTTITVTSADSTPPTITHTATTTATANTNISINATITDTSGIDTATLYYRAGSSGNYSELAMSAAGDVYSATIPRASVTTSGVQYYIFAIDASSSNNNAKSPSTAPTTPNTITVSSGSISINHTAVTSATVSNAITITATITGSIQSAQLYYKVTTADSWINTTMTNSSSVYTSSISSSYVVYEGLQYYLKITDSQGSITYSPGPTSATVNTVTVTAPNNDGQVNYIRGIISINGQPANSTTQFRVTVTSGSNNGYYYTGYVDDSRIDALLKGNGYYYTSDQSGFSTGANFTVSLTGYSGNATGTFLDGGNGDFVEMTNLVNISITTSSNTSNNTRPNVNITLNNNGTITLNWNGTISSQYDIYYITDYASGFSNTPNITITGTSWTDSNAALYSQRYYKVAPNGSALLSTPVGKFNIPLYTGMNLISLPLDIVNKSFNSIIRQNSSFYPIREISVRKTDGSGQFMIATYYPSFGVWSSGGDPFATLEQDKGYWFRLSEDYNLTIVGSVSAQNRTVGLNDGMNLIGWSSVNSTTFAASIQQNSTYYPIREISVRKTDGSGQFMIATYYPSFGVWSSAGDPFTGLEPGKGYWFRVSGEYTWNYRP